MSDRDFERFVVDAEPRLRQVFVARYGREVGREVTADALAYAWEHWPRVSTFANPLGYLFRVGQSCARRYRRREPAQGRPGYSSLEVFDPDLDGALADLSERQRAVVVLVVGLGWTHQEASDALGIRRSTVQNHVERGVRKLRMLLGGSSD